MNNNKGTRGKKVGGCSACAKARAARLAKIKAEQEAKAAAAKPKAAAAKPKAAAAKPKVAAAKPAEKKMEVINEEPCEYCDEVKE